MKTRGKVEKSRKKCEKRLAAHKKNATRWLIEESRGDGIYMLQIWIARLRFMIERSRTINNRHYQDLFCFAEDYEEFKRQMRCEGQEIIA